MTDSDSSGKIALRFASDSLARWIASLPAPLDAADAVVVGRGRNRLVRVEAPLAGGDAAVMVKLFGPPAWWARGRARRLGSKARRAYEAARRLEDAGVPTPAAVAWVERADGSSVLVTRYAAGTVTLREALVELWNDDPQAEKFLVLLDRVARCLRAMHDAGFVHGDLGNTNVLLVPEGGGRWRDPSVVDLNRGRLGAPPSLRERARDLCRLTLPSHLRSLFLRMYWGAPPPRDLKRWSDRYLRLHALWIASRRWRHPLREARQARSAGRPSRGYPARRDLWLWDERCGQPLAPMLRAERSAEYPLSRHLAMARATLAAGPRVLRAYRALVDTAFTREVPMGGRFGVALDASSLAPAREVELLAGLGARLPAFVRFHHHEPRERRERRYALVDALERAGHPYAIALVQDRRAVADPASWRGFASEVVERAGLRADFVEVGHAINRTKWGLWDFDELAALYAPLPDLHARHPSVSFTGPSAIDFEYPFVLAALERWPRGVPLAALAHQLYVDRRGAPEAPQGRYGAVEKFALALAMAKATPYCADRLVVTEVNWPIAGTAPYCPVSTPWPMPGQASGKTAVDEDAYADYMLRYLVLAAASGFVERVYWWRLASHGFGLVDDLDPTAPRMRPAYGMLAAYVALLGDATFLHADLPPRAGERAGRYRFDFRRPDGERVALVYAHGAPRTWDERDRVGSAVDAFGKALDGWPAFAGRRPVYLRSIAW
jgi:hypothetical protein